MLALHTGLFLLARACLLRLPSEALPVTAGCTEGAAALYYDGDNLCLNLGRLCVTSLRAQRHVAWERCAKEE